MIASPCVDRLLIIQCLLRFILSISSYSTHSLSLHSESALFEPSGSRLNYVYRQYIWSIGGRRMIENYWYAILPSKKVKKDIITSIRRLNLKLALFRNTTGEVCCVADQCTHRGASLSIGKVQGDCIKCPFHGLEFDKNGTCTLIPAQGIASTIKKERFNIKHYLVREEHGIIFLWYGDPQKATDTLPFVADELDEFETYSEIEDRWNSHYTRCIENQLDVIHLPFVHYNTIGRGNKTVVNGPKLVVGEDTLLISADNEQDHGQTPKPAEQCVIKPTYLKFQFPNLWVNHISNTVKVMIYFAPVDDENTVLYIRFYSKASPLKPINKLMAFFGRYANRVIERQDKRVVITQLPKASQLKMGENLLSGDRPIVEFRKMRDRKNNPQS